MQLVGFWGIVSYDKAAIVKDYSIIFHLSKGALKKKSNWSALIGILTAPNLPAWIIYWASHECLSFISLNENDFILLEGTSIRLFRDCSDDGKIV